MMYAKVIDDVTVKVGKGHIILVQPPDVIVLNIDQARTLAAFIEEIA